MKRHLLVPALALGLCLPSAPLLAQGVLVVQRTTLGPNAQTMQLQIEKDRLRTETTTVNGEKQVAIFDGEQLTTINVDRKTYVVITKADLERMTAQLTNAMSMMQAQLASMPPEQRAQIEAQMQAMSGGRMGAAMSFAPPPKPEYRKTGTDMVGQWTCDKYEGTANGEKTSEVCTVDPSTLGFVMPDFDIASKLVEFMKAAVPAQAQQAFAPGTMETRGYVGVPVRTIIYFNGQPQFSSELQAITRQTFPASIYEVPAGFQRQDSPFGAMGRGRGTP